jgi:hypothetical protein
MGAGRARPGPEGPGGGIGGSGSQPMLCCASVLLYDLLGTKRTQLKRGVILMGILSWLFGSKERSRRSAGSATIWTDDDLNRRKRSADEWQEWEPTQRPPNADGEWAQIIDVHVKGTGHRRDDFDSFVREVKSADTSGKPHAIRVVREPDNPHDRNAIAIHADIGARRATLDTSHARRRKISPRPFQQKCLCKPHFAVCAQRTIAQRHSSGFTGPPLVRRGGRRT